jgi:hypothetical protein
LPVTRLLYQRYVIKISLYSVFEKKNLKNCILFEDILLCMKSTLFQNVTPCRPVETVYSSEILVEFYRTTRLYTPEHYTLHNHRCKSLRPSIYLWYTSSQDHRLNGSGAIPKSVVCNGVIFILNLVKTEHLLQSLQGRLAHKLRQHDALVSLISSLIKGGILKSLATLSALCGQCAAGTACKYFPMRFSFVSDTWSV